MASSSLSVRLPGRVWSFKRQASNSESCRRGSGLLWFPNVSTTTVRAQAVDLSRFIKVGALETDRFLGITRYNYCGASEI